MNVRQRFYDNTINRHLYYNEMVKVMPLVLQGIACACWCAGLWLTPTWQWFSFTTLTKATQQKTSLLLNKLVILDNLINRLDRLVFLGIQTTWIKQSLKTLFKFFRHLLLHHLHLFLHFFRTWHLTLQLAWVKPHRA